MHTIEEIDNGGAVPMGEDGLNLTGSDVLLYPVLPCFTIADGSEGLEDVIDI